MKSEKEMIYDIDRDGMGTTGEREKWEVHEIYRRRERVEVRVRERERREGACG